MNIFKSKYTTSILLTILFTSNLLSQELMSGKINTIVIDAGHGGRDPGAVGKSYKEKDITLSIALKLGYLINQRFPEVNVVYTRKDDRFIELFQRSEIANKAKGDLFISIHANSNVNRDANGVEFWVLGLHKADDNLEVVKKENAALQFEDNVNKNYGFDPNSPEVLAMMTMKQGLYLEKSIQFAKTVENKFTVDENQLVRGTKQAGFVVLYQTNMPSTLVEVGFISNPDEEQFIGNEYGQAKIASKIASAIADYKKNFEAGSLKPVDPKTLNNEKKTTTQINTTSANSRIVIEDEPTNTKTVTPTTSASNTTNNNTKQPVKTNPQATQKTLSSQSPNSAVLNPSNAKSRIVIDDEMEIQNSFSDQPIKTKPQQSISKPIEKSTSAASKPPLDNYSKESIASNENNSNQPPVNSNSTPSSSEFSFSKTKKKVEIIDKSLENQSLEKNAKSNSKSSNSVSTEEPKIEKNVPSYMKDESVRKEIMENAKKISSKADVVEKVEKSAPPKPKKTEEIQTVIPSKVESNEIKKTISNSNDIIYKVQVKASSSQLAHSDKVFKLGEEIEESFESGMYKYLVGNFTSESEAKSLQQSIKGKGIADCFIVKYSNGVRVK